MKILKLVGIVLTIAFVAIQFVRPAKNVSTENSPQHLANTFDIPQDVRAIIDNACVDCHSDNTQYPWYAEVQPVGWLLARDVKEGKKHLNFSQFGARRLRIQFHKLEEIETQVEDEEMPPPAYQWMHPEAKLTDAQRTLLIDWSKEAREKMKSVFPIDSLK